MQELKKEERKAFRNKKRHINIFWKFCSESASGDAINCKEGFSEILSLLEDFKVNNVLNTDKTGLFHQCFPKGEES